MNKDYPLLDIGHCLLCLSEMYFKQMFRHYILFLILRLAVTTEMKPQNLLYTNYVNRLPPKPPPVQQPVTCRLEHNSTDVVDTKCITDTGHF